MSLPHPATPPIPVHESARPERLNAALLAALRARRVPGRWLYEGAEQARRWLAYHQACSPSRADGEMARLYDAAFAWAVRLVMEQSGAGTVGGGTVGGGGARNTGGGGLQAVSLGCGGGEKDARLLAAARRQMEAGWRAPDKSAPAPAQAALRYFPLDASPALVGEAARHVAGSFPDLPIHPLVADLAAAPDLGGWPAAGGAALFTCFGMVPNFAAVEFPRYVRGLLGAGDGLLISANLSPEGMEADRAAILPQYDNALALRWYGGALEALGFSPHRLELAVGARALAPDGSAWQIVVEAELTGHASLNLAGEEVTFEAGERIEVFFSNRFTRQAFEQVLAQAGLRVEQAWVHASGEEGIFYCNAET